jgi:RNA-directed DNA polymerase
LKKRINVSKAKPFNISKAVVWEAFQAVKANKGSAGVDGITVKDFEERLEDNLYKIWNRMSSSTYFPPPVRTVEIPKSDGKMRKLGIPTVPDRVAQMVVKMYLEPKLDPLFHPDSYGYRPRKSAIQALEVARKRCWKFDWVIDLDIKGFFDNMDHELVMKAVRKHTEEKWILLYVERWLKAPAQLADGTQVLREQGTPQGGVISPLLANLFMHHAFDEWMKRNHPDNPFERYADDVVVHCNTEAEAKKLLEAIRERLKQCKLELHPDKTKIVYCKDDNRKDDYVNEKFDFLGYTFRIRKSQSRRGGLFMNFLPAISDKATKRVREEVRKWNIHRRTDMSLEELAAVNNLIIRGWVNHYGKFYRSKLDEILKCIDMDLAKWAQRKYKKLRGSIGRAIVWVKKIRKRDPELFAHWKCA